MAITDPDLRAQRDAFAHGDYLNAADCDPDTCSDIGSFACPDCDAHLHWRAVRRGGEPRDGDRERD